MKETVTWSLWLGLMMGIAACDSPPPPPSENAPAGPGKLPPALKNTVPPTPGAMGRPATGAGGALGATAKTRATAETATPPGTAGADSAPRRSAAPPRPAIAVLEPSTKGPGFGIVPTALPAAKLPAPESAVYFWVREVGAVRLGDKGFRRIPNTQDEYCADLTRGPDGGARMVGWGVSDLSAAGLETVASRAAIGNVIHDHASFGRADQLAVSKFRDVWSRAGTTWRRASSTAIGFGQGAIKGTAIDGQGRLWLVTTYGLYVRDGEVWKRVFDTHPQTRKLFFSDIRLLSGGRLLLVASGGLAVYDGAQLAWHPVRAYMNKNAQLGPDGAIYLVGFNAVSVIDPKGFQVANGFALAESKTGATRIDKATVDGQGRVWLATDAGIIILDRALRPTHWPTGSMPVIAGRIAGLVAVGEGPADIRPAGPIRTGTIRGALHVGAQPAANTPIEICDMPRLSYDVSPCAKRPVMRQTQTNAQGEFVFDGVPVSAYSVMAKLDGKWRRAAVSVCSGMVPDQTCEVKTLTIRAP